MANAAKLGLLLLAAWAGAWLWRSAHADPQEQARRRLARLSPAPASVNVVLITIDTLRADRIGPYGFKGVPTPALDALASDGVVFEQSTAVVPLTLPSHASLLTGLLPGHHGIHDNGTAALGQDRETLAERFKEAGFATGGFLGAWVLESRFGMGQGFDRYSDRFETGRYERPAAAVVDDAMAWIDTVTGAGAGRFFAWLHLFDPHQPYAAPEPWGSRYRAEPYLGEIAYSDEQIGRLVAHLQARGLMQRTVVVVTADHGESLGEHSEWGHGFFIYDSTMAVPLIVRTPWSLRGRSRTQVSGVDVLPTLLDLAALTPQPDIDGGSLLRALLDPRVELGHAAYSETWYPRNHFGWQQLRSLRAAATKYIEAPRPEYYDLAKDPSESANMYASLGARADELRGALQRKGAGDGRADAVPGGGGDAALRERLAALGYASAALRTDPAAVLPDPKDKVSLFTALEVAKGLAVEGQLEAGIAAARKVVDADPAVMEAHIALGDWLRQAGRLGESIDAYQHALALRPDDDATLMPLVEACRAAGRPRAAREALAAFEAALTAQPRRPAAWYVLGTLSLELGDVHTAERALRRALELDPAMAPAQLQLASVSLRGHRFAEAEQRVRAALRLDADVPSGQYTLGQALERLGRRVAAADAYRAELRSNPDDARAKERLRALGARGE